MMINWKTSLIAIGALILLPIGTYATEFSQEVNTIQESSNMRHFAQRMKHGKRGRGQHINKLMQQLDLSPEQSQQIEAIQEESKATADEVEQQLRSQREEIKSLMASNASTEEIRAQYQETQALRQRMGDNRFETMLQIREVLTSEQRSKMTELMEQHRGKNL